MNMVMLTGRPVRKPEIRTSNNKYNSKVARFVLAVDRRSGKEKSTDFISCVGFGKVAEFVETYIQQGTRIAVKGTWKTGSYKNREGQTVYTNDCMMESIEFAQSIAR